MHINLAHAEHKQLRLFAALKWTLSLASVVGTVALVLLLEQGI
jgi:hypothetical protein